MMKNLQKLAIYLCLSLAMSLSVYGQQKDTGELSLSAPQIAIVPIATFAARGDQDNLKNALDQGLEAGLTVNEIKEILIRDAGDNPERAKLRSSDTIEHYKD